MLSCKARTFWQLCKTISYTPHTCTLYTSGTVNVSTTHSERVREIVQKHMAPRGLNALSTPLQDNDMKSQILRSCEKEFNQTIPDSELGFILTVNDVIKFFERCQQNTNPHSVFPNVDKARTPTLPPNLSFPQVMDESSPIPNRTRVPFQNFDSSEHASFLNKQQKEERKRKRRHLTAWK